MRVGQRPESQGLYFLVFISCLIQVSVSLSFVTFYVTVVVVVVSLLIEPNPQAQNVSRP